MTTAPMKLDEAVSDGTRTERFWVVEQGIDKLIAALAPPAG